MLGFNAIALVAVVVTIVFGDLPAALALRTASGSPCAGVCHKTSTNTTSSEIVCLDPQYNSTSTGSDFQNCVECELQSTYSDSSSGESDVIWGLYNLRYAFASCVYGYPQQIDNISSPCIVTCSSLGSAMEYDLAPPNAANFDNLCGLPSFADNAITSCEFCYNMTTSQIYLANFIESIRYNCHYGTKTKSKSKTTPHKPFAIHPSKIFTQSALPPSFPDPSGSSTPKNLVVIIVIPILAAILIIASAIICCVCCIRRRRRQAKRRSEEAQLQALWDDATLNLSTPIPRPYGPPNHESGGEGQTQIDSALFASGGVGPSFAFGGEHVGAGVGVGSSGDYGRGHGEGEGDGVGVGASAAFPKSASLVEVTEPAVSVPAASYYGHEEKGI